MSRLLLGDVSPDEGVVVLVVGCGGCVEVLLFEFVEVEAAEELEFELNIKAESCWGGEEVPTPPDSFDDRELSSSVKSSSHISSSLGSAGAVLKPVVRKVLEHK